MATINGTSGNDTLNGTASSDVVDGLAGNDKLSGLAGVDTLIGGLGNDTLIGGAGGDTLMGDEGIDTADYSSSTARVRVYYVDYDDYGNDVHNWVAQGGDANGDSLYDIENITGSVFGDSFGGNDLANALWVKVKSGVWNVLGMG
jgi:hypothetical protein